MLKNCFTHWISEKFTRIIRDELYCCTNLQSLLHSYKSHWDNKRLWEGCYSTSQRIQVIRSGTMRYTWGSALSCTLDFFCLMLVRISLKVFFSINIDIGFSKVQLPFNHWLMRITIFTVYIISRENRVIL